MYSYIDYNQIYLDLSDCDIYSFRCDEVRDEFSKACVSSQKLCDDIEDCDDGSDEEINEDDGTW